MDEDFELELPEPKSAEEQLIEQHASYARKLAQQIASGLPSGVDTRDLEQDAVQGLIEAAQRFDSSRGATFTTFAYLRIRGAVFDGIRRQSWLPPQARLTAAKQAAEDAFIAEAFGHEAEAREVDFDAEARRFKAAIGGLGVVFRLTDLVATEAEGESGLEPESPDRTDAEVEARDEARTLQQAIELLPPDERRVIVGYYFEGLAFKDLATELDLDPANISRRHQRALERLQGVFDGRNLLSD